MTYQKTVTALTTIKNECQRILEGARPKPKNDATVSHMLDLFSKLLPFISALAEGADLPSLPAEEKKKHAIEISRLKRQIEQQKKLLYKISSAGLDIEEYL